jgi:CubicO group peptidase (beta-lactamase class C family)
MLRLSDTLGDHLGEAAGTPLGRVRLDHMLSHRAGLHTLRSVESAAAPPALRRLMAYSAAPPDAWDPDRHGAYSEWLAWFLLREVIEAVTGERFEVVLTTRLLRPIGIDGEVLIGARLHGRESDIGVNVDLRGISPMPLLMERATWFTDAADPSLNGYATMRGLAGFYQWVLDTLRGDPSLVEPEVLRDACRPHRASVHDQVLGWATTWGLGFMTDLGDSGFGPLVGARAVGHTGQVGTSTAFADPDHDLAVAVLYNGIIDQPTGIAMRRPAIVSDIYRDLGLRAGVSVAV